MLGGQFVRLASGPQDQMRLVERSAGRLRWLLMEVCAEADQVEQSKRHLTGRVSYEGGLGS